MDESTENQGLSNNNNKKKSIFGDDIKTIKDKLKKINSVSVLRNVHNDLHSIIEYKNRFKKDD